MPAAPIGGTERIRLECAAMKNATAKGRPNEYILAVLSPEERLDAALRVAREAFKDTELTLADVENAVREVRRRRHGGRATEAARRR